MNRLISCAFVLALSPLAAAQDQATTLFACSRDAAVVVRATALAATDPSPDWHRLQFRADEVLKGTVTAEFVLLEPAGACCGRSLFALRPGDRCLLFLRRTGPALHPLGGARGVLADEPLLVDHVRALLAANGDAEAAALLVDGLQAAESRIADDAAQSLAVLPTLSLTPTDRSRIATALTATVQTGSTRAAPLLEVAARLQDPVVMQALVGTYLTTSRTDQANLLRRGLARCSPDVLLGAVPTAGIDAAQQLRSAELFAQLPMDRAAPVLRTMLATTSCPRVKLCAAEALLEAGATADEVRQFLPTEVLQLAQRRRDTARTFRSIRPNRP